MAKNVDELIGVLEGIVHQLPATITPTMFEQSTPATRPESASDPPNRFFLPFRDHHKASRKSARAPSRAPDAPARSNTPTIVEMLATAIEGHHLVDRVEFRSKLELLLLNTEHLRSVSAKHRVLKADILDFLYRDDFALPKNPCVGDAIARALRANVVMRHDDAYRVHLRDDAASTVLLSVSKVERYDRLEDLARELKTDGAAEIRPFASMRIAELREYARSVLPTADVDPKASKVTLVELLRKRFDV